MDPFRTRLTICSREKNSCREESGGSPAEEPSPKACMELLGVASLASGSQASPSIAPREHRTCAEAIIRGERGSGRLSRPLIDPIVGFLRKRVWSAVIWQPLAGLCAWRGCPPPSSQVRVSLATVAVNRGHVATSESQPTPLSGISSAGPFFLDVSGSRRMVWVGEHTHPEPRVDERSMHLPSSWALLGGLERTRAGTPSDGVSGEHLARCYWMQPVRDAPWEEAIHRLRPLERGRRQHRQGCFFSPVATLESLA